MTVSADELAEFLVALHSRYGYDFTDYSEASMKRRILEFMAKHRVGSIGDLNVLMRDESKVELLVQEISVTVTEMFRDPPFFKALREKVVPRLATYPVIRIWVAGCATGEEVYSLAIMLKEEKLLDRCIIYATDINRRSLQVAKEGIYPIGSIKLYTANHMNSGGKEPFSRYYSANYDAALFDRSLRRNIVFAPHNLAIDRAFNEFQLITCRNVLIYFNQKLQSRVIDLFYESLCAFGFLGMGTKESLLFSEKRERFQELDSKMKVFVKSK